jgi:hypothetical protein
MHIFILLSKTYNFGYIHNNIIIICQAENLFITYIIFAHLIFFGYFYTITILAQHSRNT